MTAPVLVWLRDDLRVADNPALTAAVAHGGPVVVVVVHDEQSSDVRPLGGAARWWWHGSLAALAARLEELGAWLVLRRGAAEQVIPALVAEIGASAVVWNRRYTPARAIDARLRTRLTGEGIDVHSFAAALLVEPGTVLTGGGTPYRVFTPFWRAASALDMRSPLPAPERIRGLRIDGDHLDDWGLLPSRPDWAAGLRASWTPGEDAALARLDEFATSALADYHRRDEPGVEATSHLSPRLRFGELSPAQVWARVHAPDLSPAARRNVAKFGSELGWREFNAQLLFDNENLATRNYRPEFDAFPWGEADPAELTAWQQGRTGIPIVDAGMRELWHTGTMHNRVRMIAASFLIKNLLVDWRIGEAWFWDTLVDADEASNPGNWQWVAGSGSDAAPYFRIFNPVTQAARFDPDETYLRRWLPELGTADYPEPIVELGASRARALDAYQHMRATSAPPSD
ncbi:deoxyribodipyrimidine photo-lyase [uncultured Schumannella sp.]|uniref:cryptochrome/photolyase family protein n=1 Tax=uncultured Schumannella sp. TaxID=1195956 RepID=UPI0025CCCC1F|nr:deoxyribodipyrimidine photo-lyase [uncultured Schumannella sp.]